MKPTKREELRNNVESMTDKAFKVFLPKTKNNSAHTPGEWHIETNTDHAPFVIGDDERLIAKLFDDRQPQGLFYGRTHEETTANAERIVKACNSHDEICEALHEMILIVEQYRVLGKLGYEQELAYHKAATTYYKATK